MEQYAWERRPKGDWMSKDLFDMTGREFSVGDRFAKACTSGRAVNLEIGIVTKIADGKMYANDSKVPIHFPGRLLIVNEVISMKDLAKLK